MSRSIRFVSATMIAAFVLSVFSFVVVPPLTPQAAAQAPTVPGSYIVVLQPDVPDVAAAAQDVARTHGGTVTYVYDVVLGGFAINLPNEQAAEAVARNPNVAFIEQDKEVHAFQDAAGVTASGATVPTGVDRVGADGATGAGEAVAIIDSGIASHPDLNIAGGYNCTTSNTSAWADDNGHGTHVAGTVGASGGVVGVAPGTPLYAMKVLGANGSGQWSWVICGINETARLGIPVANMSLGAASPENPGNCNSSTLHKAICDATKLGVTFAVAAGNDSSDASGYVPAKYPEVIAVSALVDSDGCAGGLGGGSGFGADDTRASFSNFGSDVDIAAPGVNIYSTYPGGYATMSGTSMASPHVAGLLALGGYDIETGTLDEGVANYPGGNITCGNVVGDTTAPTVTTTSPVNDATEVPVTTAVSATFSEPMAADTISASTFTLVDGTGTAVAATVTYDTSSSTATLTPSSTLAAGVTYTATISGGGATDEAGNALTPYSWSFTTAAAADITAPAQPTGLVASAVSATQVDLAWDPVGETDLAGYNVYRDGVSVASGIIGTSYADTTVSGDTMYSYTVTAVDTAGNESGPSNAVTITTPPEPVSDTTPPSTPTLQGTVISGSQIDLSWSGATDDVGVAGYDVYRDDGAGAFLLASGVTTTVYSDMSLTGGATYSYYVVAFDAAGNSTASNTITLATPAPAPTDPTAPTIGAVEPKGPAIFVNWTDNATDETYYQVYRSQEQDAEGNWINWTPVSGQLAPDTTKYRDPSVTSGTTYVYKVEVCNAAGLCAESEPSADVTPK